MHHRLRKIRNARRWRSFSLLKRLRRNEQGVQLVELAIVMPIFLLMFGATAEFGRYFYEYSTLAKASRVGARYLATAGLRDPMEDVRATNLIVYGNIGGTGSPILNGLGPANVKITRAGGPSTNPDRVTVEIINFRHKPIVDLGKLTSVTSLSLDIDVKPSVTMRRLLIQPI